VVNDYGTPGKHSAERGFSAGIRVCRHIISYCINGLFHSQEIFPALWRLAEMAFGSRSIFCFRDAADYSAFRGRIPHNSRVYGLFSDGRGGITSGFFGHYLKGAVNTGRTPASGWASDMAYVAKKWRPAHIALASLAFSAAAGHVLGVFYYGGA